MTGAVVTGTFTVSFLGRGAIKHSDSIGVLGSGDEKWDRGLRSEGAQDVSEAPM